MLRSIVIAAIALAASIPVSAAQAGVWYRGTFRSLPELSSTAIVKAGEQPSVYTEPSAARRTRFRTFIDALMAAVDHTNMNQGVDNTYNWCDVYAKAKNAGYKLYRLWDTSKSRYYVYAEDTASSKQQVRIFVNPIAPRNIVLEVGHNGNDGGTRDGGCNLFYSDLGARWLIVNGSKRCASTAFSGCYGDTPQCSGSNWPKSDVPHDLTNLFHELHLKLSAKPGSSTTGVTAGARFVQIHSNGGRYDWVFSDATNVWNKTSSVSITAQSNIIAQGSPVSETKSCNNNGSEINPSNNLCGKNNLQGLSTNGAADICHITGSSAYSGRFLHVEAASCVWNGFCSTGSHWTHLVTALKYPSLFGSCNLVYSCATGGTNTRYTNLNTCS